MNQKSLISTGRYLEVEQLEVAILGRGLAWLDTGRHESLLEASQFIDTLDKRHGLEIACPEEIAYRLCYADAARLEQLGTLMKNRYGQYLLQIAKEKVF